ncbi:hypothetical protein C6P40_002906 [Pichia californica]|uniref:Uncharacterized protein n=1 Tax=Pichia californica TaxID=460514 RepID=A0A9P6WQY8_9ASCO|nr:hypothetical protein C6P40_002906 [[Candida] californica]
MTVESSKQFNIKSVAIIGSGPSGIASLYELSRLTKDGKSLFGKTDISEYEKNGDLAFTELVAFERNKSAGGVWSKSAFGDNNIDPNLPSNENENIDFSNPKDIYQNFKIDSKLEEKLKNSSQKNPIKIPFTDSIDSIIKNQWRSSAAYNGLFTNVTNRYMSFSFDEIIGDDLNKLNSKYKHLPNFQSSVDVSNYLENVIKRNNLEKYIRFNTNVERVKKLDNNKWEVIVNEIIIDNDGKKYLNWYKQIFDAVIIGNGKTIPIVPNIKGLKEFSKINKDKVNIKLAKSIQDPSFLKSAKKPLFIGSSVSSIDLLQYTFPRDLEKPSVYISRRALSANSSWVTSASYSKGIINKPTIKEFIPEKNSILFEDGTIESGFDVIIICTGYHMHYPFLEIPYDKLKFYKYTFSIDDPTLALVGNTYAGFFFNRVESQGAAIASIWNNNKKLPSNKEQINDYENAPKMVTGTINSQFISPLIELAVDGRPHPFSVNKEKTDHVYHQAVGTSVVLNLFFNIRNGTVDIKDVFN